MPSAFDWIGIGITLAISALCLVFDSFLLMFRSCYFFNIVSDISSPFGIFLTQHVWNENAENCKNPDNHQTSFKAYWWTCESSTDNKTTIWTFQQSDKPSHEYTDSDSLMIFVIVHLILHLVWAFVTSGVVLGRATRRWNFLWLYSTAAVLSYGAVVAGVFTVEIIEAKDCLDYAFQHEDKGYKNQVVDILLGQLVFPIYMSYGVIFWIFILILWCMMLSKVLCNSTSHVPKSKRNPQNRSLSETHSEDYSQKMNKRFDKAQDIEEDESGTSHDTLVKRSKLAPHHAPPREPSSSDWVYANPALVMDFDMVTSRGVPSSDVAASPTSPTAPKSFHRTMSNSSGTSEGRRLGRPTSMPPLPAIDYKLPRASVTKTPDQAKIQKSSRKAIRTPSGKSMSATEYLRGGYRPTEKSLSEEVPIHPTKS